MRMTWFDYTISYQNTEVKTEEIANTISLMLGLPIVQTVNRPFPNGKGSNIEYFTRAYWLELPTPTPTYLFVGCIGEDGGYIFGRNFKSCYTGITKSLVTPSKGTNVENGASFAGFTNGGAGAGEVDDITLTFVWSDIDPYSVMVMIGAQSNNLPNPSNTNCRIILSSYTTVGGENRVFVTGQGFLLNNEQLYANTYDGKSIVHLFKGIYPENGSKKVLLVPAPVIEPVDYDSKSFSYGQCNTLYCFIGFDLIPGQTYEIDGSNYFIMANNMAMRL